MVMNFVSYKLCKLSVCLMCFQIFVVCINHFPQFTYIFTRSLAGSTIKSTTPWCSDLFAIIQNLLLVTFLILLQ
jgi:hypothetical protein